MGKSVGKPRKRQESDVFRTCPSFTLVFPSCPIYCSGMTQNSNPDPAVLADFGSAVRAARERAGKRQFEFAAQMGISPSHLSNIEAGRKSASLAIYWRIANSLGIDAEGIVNAQAAS